MRLRPPLKPASHRPWLHLALVVGSAGCAGVYRVDNRVESFARWTDGASRLGRHAAAVPAPPQTYRFERLPSQTSGTAAQSADRAGIAGRKTALAPLGWTPAADASKRAPGRVQVSADHQRLPRAPWEDPWDEGAVRLAHARCTSAWAWATAACMWSPWLLRSEHALPPAPQSRLVIRDAADRAGGL